MKLPFLVTIISIAFFSSPKLVLAYGGGGGMPPGYYGNHNHHSIHCALTNKEIKHFGVKVPKCEFRDNRDKNEGHDKQHDKNSEREEFRGRLSSFGKRLAQGHR